MAARPKPSVVLRGGYGIYYDRHSGNLASQTMDQPPFAIQQFVEGAANGAANLASPFVPIIPSISQFPQFMPLSENSSLFIEATNPRMRDGMTQEYNLNLQYALNGNWLLQVGYVGAQSMHRSGQLEFDQALLASPSNPVNGETTNSINNVTARLPYQGISEGSLFTDSVFVANYNAFQATVRRRMGHGLEFEGAYTWSKNLDEVNGETGTRHLRAAAPNQQPEHPAQINVPEACRRMITLISDWSSTSAWTTPRWNTRPRWRERSSTDWQFSGIGTIQSGIPLSVFDTNAGSVYGLLSGEVRAQRTGSSPLTHGSPFSRVINGYLDPSAFTRAPGSTERDKPRRPGFWQQRSRLRARARAAQRGLGRGTELPHFGSRIAALSCGILQPHKYSAIRQSKYFTRLWRIPRS